MGARPVSQGGRTSRQWNIVADALAAKGTTPDRYIGRLREQGYGWQQIARRLADEFGITVPETGTVRFWHDTVPGCDQA